jgi:hypothetical protein
MMRLQSRHKAGEDKYLDLDAYMTDPRSTKALIAIEQIPQRLWEPCCGDGTGMVTPLREAGYHIECSDVEDYGFPCTFPGLILDGQHPPGIEGIVTNPPYRLALDFIEAALAIVPYHAWLLRTNFLESMGRLPFFRDHPPARVWISSRRLPMMHRYGWTGPTAASNTAFAWFVWDAASEQKGKLGWFDWRQPEEWRAAA